jgi:hypothetical protein
MTAQLSSNLFPNKPSASGGTIERQTLNDIRSPLRASCLPIRFRYPLGILAEAWIAVDRL